MKENLFDHIDIDPNNTHVPYGSTKEDCEGYEKELEKVAKEYRNFLDAGKTERECVTQIIKEAQEAGYECLEEKADER